LSVKNCHASASKGSGGGSGDDELGRFSSTLSMNERMPIGFSMEDGNDLSHDQVAGLMEDGNELSETFTPGYNQHLLLHVSVHQTRSTIFYS
jgi:hypothetical protein